MDENTRFLGKILIESEMIVLTGLHIGASKETVKIGGIDSPVVRDPITNYPYIPGSSLKGKMRSLSEKVLRKGTCENSIDSNDAENLPFHVCTDFDCKVCRLFGSSKKEGKNQVHIPSRLIVRDLHLKEESVEALKKLDTGLPFTEWKFENNINRITSQANPRQIERIPAGAKFKLELIYDVRNKKHLKTDLNTIQKSLEILQLDSLGGHGSRGYGKVTFKNTVYTGYPREYYITGDPALVLKDKFLDNIIISFTGENND